VGDKDFLAATALKMRFKAIYTSLAADHFKGEICYDAHIADFQEVVILTETLIRHEEMDNDARRAAFTFDDPTVSCLYAVTSRCQHPVVRRRAIALLKSRPRRESVMNGAFMSKLATIQMSIEESRCEGNYSTYRSTQESAAPRLLTI